MNYSAEVLSDANSQPKLNMEMMAYVNKLQLLLKQHDRAVKQILKINQYISELGRQTFNAAMYGTAMQVMQLLLRKSVAEGVKKMYKQYRLKKWLRVQLLIQKKPNSIDNSLNEISDLSRFNTWFHQYPDLNMLEGADPMVQGWAVMHCEFSRYS